jgi:hypothetical protein
MVSAPSSRSDGVGEEVSPAIEIAGSTSQTTVKEVSGSTLEEKAAGEDESAKKKEKKSKKEKKKEKGKKSRSNNASSSSSGSSDESSSDDNSSSDEGDDDKKILVGSVAEHKNLYEKRDKHDRITWTEKVPEDLEEAGENDETLKFAVIVRLREYNRLA